ncbi:MAG: TonB-dependent receptor [Chitinophagaceae bacterium]|nr:MAG: TonB-dependent receptor [Chitinophagaceae bacterium]
MYCKVHIFVMLFVKVSIKNVNMKTIFLVLISLIICSLCNSVKAQSVVKTVSLAKNNQEEITGKVANENHQAVPFATVTLLKADDSALIKGNITDELGQYVFTNIPAGKYITSASVIGMLKSYSRPFEINEAHSKVMVPELILKDNTQLLKGVNVTASKPFIEHKLDKTVVNVENSVVSTGNTVLEVLEKVPGVQVDNDGNISLKGKSGVTIMINGKLTYLSQEQLTAMLKSMSASQLSQIEIITNPSAKYDASGTAGIINLKLKKNANEGFNGNVMLGYYQSTHSTYNGGLNLNYKKDKINLFGNYSRNGGGGSNDMELIRRFYNGNSKSLNSQMEQNSINHWSYTYQSIRAGIDYNINKNNTLGALITYSGNPQTSRRNGPIHFYDAGMNLDSLVVPHSEIDNSWHSVTYNLNYKLTIDTAGQELTANFDYSPFSSTSGQNYSTEYFDGVGIQLHEPKYRRGNLPSGIDIKSGKIDYTLPLKNKMQFEAGVKSSLVTSDNNVQYENQIDGKWLNDTGTTNHFIYKENINAAYINFKKELKKGWAFQLGLRGEQTVSKADQVTIDSVVNRNYFQLFPSVFVKKDLNKNNTLTFSYSRRIDRPDYGSLNPFTYYIDDYTYSQGNPFLQPQLTNSFELSHSFKSILFTTLNYSHTSDVITGIIKQNDTTHVGYEMNENLNTMNNIGISVSMPIQVTKWWMTNNFINVYRNHYNGQLEGGQLNNSLTSFNFNTTNTFTLPWDMKAELSGYYNSRGVHGMAISYPRYSVSAGVQKSFWDKRASMKLNVNDIFDTQEGGGTLHYQQINMTIHNKWESRRIGLTFSYSFGNKNLKVNQNHKTGIEDEQNRISK